MKPCRLLIFDARPDHLLSLGQMLDAHLPGCERVQAGSMAEAASAAERRAPDCALIEVGTPGALQLCKELNGETAIRAVPVLLLSFEPATPQTRCEGLQAGAVDFVSGPIDGAELATRIQVVLRARQREQELRQRTELLSRASQMRMVGDMGTAIAHELNQPLCAIMTSAQACGRLLKSQAGLKPAVHEALGHITNQAKRAAEIIRKLRDVGCRRAPHHSKIDLAALVRHAARFVLSDGATEDIQVRLSIPSHVPKVTGDAGQIEQVLISLLHNGVESIRRAGCGRGALDISVEIPQADTVEIAVRDTGEGLPDAGDERLFSPFFSTEPGGLGIGLSVSRSIIEAHGGRLWASPGPECGAVFRFTLPITRQDPSIANSARPGQ